MLPVMNSIGSPWFIPCILIHEAVRRDHLEHMRELEQDLAYRARSGNILDGNLEKYVNKLTISQEYLKN